MSVRVYPARVTDGRIWVKSEPLRARARTAQARRHRQRHGGHEGRRGAARDRARRLRHHRVRRRAAPQLQPHPAVAGAGRREARRRHHPQSARVVPRERRHAARAAIRSSRSTGVRRVVRSRSGVEAPYDRLLLATGSKPIMLPVPGHDLAGVIDLSRPARRRRHARSRARAHARPSSSAADCWGSKLRTACCKQGMDVTVVHLFDTLMERQLDRVGRGCCCRNRSEEARHASSAWPAKTAG